MKKFVAASTISGLVEKTFAEAFPGYLGYYRMYYNQGWGGRWFNENKDTTEFGGVSNMNEAEIAELNKVITCITKMSPEGFSPYYNPKLEKYGASISADGKRHLLYSEGKLLNFSVMIDVTYGNGDYPVRIYCYRK